MLLPGFTITENIKLNREITRPTILSRVLHHKSLENLDMEMCIRDRCNPVLWMTLVWLIEAAVRRRLRPQMVLCWLLMLIHLFCLLLHKSFGGFQFGARYTLELIPYAFAMLHFAPRRAPRAWEATVFSLALLFNAVGADLLNR